jgi:hypothetical protein
MYTSYWSTLFVKTEFGRLGKGVSSESAGAMQTDRVSGKPENSCWRRRKPVTVNAIELAEV